MKNGCITCRQKFPMKNVYSRGTEKDRRKMVITGKSPKTQTHLLTFSVIVVAWQMGLKSAPSKSFRYLSAHAT